MGVAWITDIYQNSPDPVWIRSRDDRNNGVVGSRFDMEDREWHQLPRGRYQCSWCGIPWFYLNEIHHYKIIDFSPNKPSHDSFDTGIRFYTSIIDGQDQICYVSPEGKTVARQPVFTGGDTNCKLVIDKCGGFYIEPINAGDLDPATVLNEVGEFVQAVAADIIQATAEAMSTAKV